MKHFFGTLILMFALSFSHAQNIVPNPVFAIADSCPYDYSQIRFATHWFDPSMFGSAEYFNSCNTSATFGVPYNAVGYQLSSSGAYASGYTFAGGASSSTREHIATDIPPLQPGALYKVTISISLADRSRCGHDGFGVYFYKNAKPDTFSNLVDLVPQIDYSSYGVIMDKTNWTILTQTFVADSAYDHLIVGNLKKDALVHYILDSTMVPLTTMPWAFYYYDSVAVEKIANAAVLDIQSQTAVSVYPNPFAESCTISLRNAPNSYDVLIFNIYGALVATYKNNNTDTFTLQRNTLDAGLYTYRISSPGGVLASGKLIVQ